MKCRNCNQEFSISDFKNHHEACKEAHTLNFSDKPLKCWTCEASHTSIDEIKECSALWGGRTKRTVIRDFYADKTAVSYNNNLHLITDRTQVGLTILVSGEEIFIPYTDVKLD